MAGSKESDRETENRKALGELWNTKRSMEIWRAADGKMGVGSV